MKFPSSGWPKQGAGHWMSQRKSRKHVSTQMEISGENSGNGS
jgi:hypothetical protein